LRKTVPKNEKAFENQKRGKVLGILFDSTDLTWSIPASKLRKTLMGIDYVVSNPVVKLNDMQKLMGRLNHVAQMCKFIKIFTPPLNESFKDIPSDAPPDTVIKIFEQGFEDLKVWVGFLQSSFKWLPIPKDPAPPPLYRKELYTDAAGLPCEDRRLLQNWSRLEKFPPCLVDWLSQWIGV
jgi:hypothetical protein